MGGAGNDTISTGTGSNLIEGGTGADFVTLLGATNVVVIGNTDSGLNLITADTINLFTDSLDSLKMGLAGDATSYVEAGAAVADFTAALAAANVALTTLNGTPGSAAELLAFEFDGTNGYLFNDINSDGVADQVIVLVGVDNTGISAANIIA